MARCSSFLLNLAWSISVAPSCALKINYFSVAPSCALKINYLITRNPVVLRCNPGYCELSHIPVYKFVYRYSIAYTSQEDEPAGPYLFMHRTSILEAIPVWPHHTSMLGAIPVWPPANRSYA